MRIVLYIPWHTLQLSSAVLPHEEALAEDAALPWQVHLDDYLLACGNVVVEADLALTALRELLAEGVAAEPELAGHFLRCLHIN